MESVEATEKNVLGGELLACSYDPLTGFFRHGCCGTRGHEGVAHLVCVRVTREFLDVGSSRVDLQACKLEYSIVSPK